MLTWRSAKRLVIGVIGGTIALFGIVLLVFPGPGIPVLIAGLAILATEFIWAQRLLKQVKQKASDAIHKARNGFRRAPEIAEKPAEAEHPPPSAEPQHDAEQRDPCGADGGTSHEPRATSRE